MTPMHAIVRLRCLEFEAGTRPQWRLTSCGRSKIRSRSHCESHACPEPSAGNPFASRPRTTTSAGSIAHRLAKSQRRAQARQVRTLTQRAAERTQMTVCGLDPTRTMQIKLEVDRREIALQRTARLKLRPSFGRPEDHMLAIVGSGSVQGQDVVVRIAATC